MNEVLFQFNRTHSSLIDRHPQSNIISICSSDDDLENEDLVPNADNIMVGIPLKTLSGN
jgi:hypothetical protein